VIRVEVDATDLSRRIFRVRQRIPISGPGPMTLLYPKWLPGYHAPQAPIELFAGLQITAGGAPVQWRRDPVEVHAFHLDAPGGVEALDVEFQFLSPTDPEQGRVLVTPRLLNLQWNTVVLYPAGYFSRGVTVEAQLTLPEGWDFGCALERASQEGATTTFKPVALDVLVDSPVFAGRHFRRLDLDAAGEVHMNIVADEAGLLAATPEQIDRHRALVDQADRLFGGRPFDRYEFLVALSDDLGAIGVEHHRSCETGTIPGYFVEWDDAFAKRDVVAHEYTHAWNGKYRRGSDSWTPSFERPIRNSLMWVYEGQTQYWGHVLSARSGIWSLDQALGALAFTASAYDIRRGREWRAMSDTTRDPIIASRAPLPWPSWQRSEDYYSEGQLVWLDVDTLIRALSDDTRSLDDFARAFFRAEDRGVTTRPYEFEEVVRTLESVASNDWAALLIERLESHTPGAPLDGLERGGYRLVYRDSPSAYQTSLQGLLGSINHSASVGLTLATDGKIKDVIWDSPAFDAGLTVGAEVVAVNSRAFSGERLARAIAAAMQGEPLELLVKSGERFRTAAIEYRGGLRFPHLEPIPEARRRLDEIYSPRA
jgi:predicted metalloprotease with PDZ domain